MHVNSRTLSVVNLMLVDGPAIRSRSAGASCPNGCHPECGRNVRGPTLLHAS